VATFTVSVVVDGLDLGNHDLDLIFEVLPDAVPASVAGIVSITSPIDAHSAENAAMLLVDEIRRMFPHAIPLRLDQDLVAIPDIAARMNRGRESVRLLVDGKRGPGGFPPPVGVVGDGIRVWPWAVVADWLAARLGFDTGERLVSPEVAARVDALLAEHRQAGAHQEAVRRQHVTWAADPIPVSSRLYLVSGSVGPAAA